MRIGIITIHNSLNYGASLQSWSLYKFLVDHGYDCEIIDLHRPAHSDYVYSKKYVDYYGVCERDRKLTVRAKQWLRNMLTHRSKPDYMIRREEKFNRFNGQIKLSKTYRGIDELYDNPPEYDVYITGSDQVWNPTQPFCIEPFFLTFVRNPKARKISYAPSIAESSLTEREKSDFVKWLSDYSYISVREFEGQALLRSMLDKEIYQVADPTFLMGAQYWRSLAKESPLREPYILCFRLCDGNKLVDYCIEMGKKLGMKVVVLPLAVDRDDKCVVVKDAGLEDYLGYIANADILVSDSFHGNVFGILLGVKKQWAYIYPDSNRGSRLVSLMETFGMSDHFIASDFSTTCEEFYGKTKNLENIERVIESEANRSREFLLRALTDK